MGKLELITDDLLFSPDRLVEPASWAGHIPFAMWFLGQFKPEILVELGTHTGNSYFSFCQSISSNRLNTRCYAVDTWQGDLHAGSYDDEVFKEVHLYNEKKYAAFSRLMRMTFDEAESYFSDGSIDFLHIDGLHSYEAVHHDFYTWLPKLSDRAVVFFHDINVREKNFGVWKLWEELSAEYKHISFSHSNGLGVLFVGDSQSELVTNVHNLWANVEKKNLLCSLFERLGSIFSLQIDKIELTKITLDQRAHMVAHLERISNLNNQLSEVKEDIDRLNVYIGELKDRSDKLNVYIGELKDQLVEQDGQIVQLCTQKEELQNRAEEFLDSNSWKMTYPFRFMTTKFRQTLHYVRTLRNIIQQKGGLSVTLNKLRKIYFKEGFAGLKRRFHSEMTQCEKNADSQLSQRKVSVESQLSIVPHYIEALQAGNHASPIESTSIAIHIHLFYVEMTEQFTSRLQSFPYEFDLYLSISEMCNAKDIHEQLESSLPKVKKIIVETVPNRGRDIAPFIIQFGQRLAEYNIVGHFHSKKSPPF